ncbi:MAG: ABC transporter permease [Cyclobacteriaceae bacterium]|nr:ABC transporter permease [Cyclobacteriaceae bacterium]
MANKTKPPEYAVRFLEWFCPAALYEGIEGDLVEAFDADMKLPGDPRAVAARARRRFAWNVLKFFRPGVFLRNKFTLSLFKTMMIRNYLKVAARNIQKQKLYSFINSFGLSIGIAFCILIFLYIEDEKSFDQFHENKQNIFRMEEKQFDTWQHDPKNPYNRSAWLQTGLMPAMKADLAEVELATRYIPESDGIFRYQDKVFTEKLSYADPDFFKMFSFKLIAGNADKLFQNKTDAVIVPEIAKKYFGDEDPIGKTVMIDIEGEKPFTIVGLIEAAPANSSFEFKILLPQPNRAYYERNLDNWGNFNTPTFVQLKPNTNLDVFRANLAKFVDKHMGERLEKWKKRSTVPIPPDVKMFEYEFTRLPDMHLKKEISWHKVSDVQYSFILGAIAVLIMTIACINYISLALTTSTARRTEVGIRKVVGAQKSQLIYQFGFESLLLSTISMLVGFALVILFLPSFNEFTGKGISLLKSDWVSLAGASLAITLTVGLIAGSYPSLFLSGFRPVQVLKGRFTSRLNAGFAKPLVVLQFALSSFLIISSVIMYRQMDFITTKDLGYDQNQILVIPTQKGWNVASDQTVAQFRARLSQETDIVSVAGTSSSFNQGWSRYGYRIDGEQKSAYVYAVDPQYITTLDIELVMGRNFDPAIASDSSALIVNESLVKDMKWTDPLNSFLNWQEDSLGKGSRIIGVAKDYHFRSLESGIDPLLLSMDKKNVGYLTTMLVKIRPDNIPATMEKVGKIWKEMYPDRPYDYVFLDDDVARQYKSYKRWMSTMGLSTGFAILISCLGLFGLSGINAVNRTKEIGIRKVMGAELSNIFLLLNRQFVWLSLIAFVIAAPASWYVITRLFLKDFEFKITIGWELFAVSIMAGLILALVTVSYHAIKVALSNPAETLKYE